MRNFIQPKTEDLKYSTLELVPSKLQRLSEREYQAFRCLELGMKNNAIAEFLNINEKTVSTYIGRLKTKIGITAKGNDLAVVEQARIYIEMYNQYKGL